MGRESARASRCQRLTGSYNGSSRSCPCIHPLGCKLTDEERKKFENHPDVIEARNRNRVEFERLYQK